MRHTLQHAVRWLCLGLFTAWLTGCATTTPQRDYSAYRAANPRSILVLPPLNDSPEVQATVSVLSHATLPLAEAGYYVIPVTLMTETFRQNGMEMPADIHDIAPKKLHEIFAADTALYIKVTRYGVSYKVIASEAVVTAQARLVDLRTGAELWQGRASASSEEGKSNSGGLAGMLIAALVNQVINSVTDASHPGAGGATRRLLSAGHPNGLLYGPRSPLYGKN